MKKVFLFCILCFSFVFAFSLQAKEKQDITKIKFYLTEFDLGTCKKDSAITDFLVPFENTGKHDLLIENVVYGCSCMKVQYDKKPIPPGRKGFFKVSVDLHKTLSPVVIKSFKVYSNTKTPQVEIYFRMKITD